MWIGCSRNECPNTTTLLHFGTDSFGCQPGSALVNPWTLAIPKMGIVRLSTNSAVAPFISFLYCLEVRVGRLLERSRGALAAPTAYAGLVQWFASERRRRSYVPVAFWYFSLAGGLMTFTYAYLRQEPVFMLAQGLGITIYARNLTLIYRRRWRYRQRRFADKQATSISAEPNVSDGVQDPAPATATSTS